MNVTKIKFRNEQLTRGSVWFGLHFAPGTAQYEEPGKEPYKILLNEQTIKNMDKTFAGCPVFIDHVDEVSKETIPYCVGYVTESFYNAPDGMHWAKFIITDADAENKIKDGYKLSNSYIPKQWGPGGTWHGMPYEKEVLSGEFEHLAIVNNPRYAESVILDPEAFKAYNASKTAALARVANSLKTSKPKPAAAGVKNMFNIFKREKVDNALDLESMMVELPKSKKEITLANAINIADRVTNMQGYADSDHRVKVNEEEMSVGEMVNMCAKMKSDMAKMNAEKAEKEAKDNADEDESKDNEDEESSTDNDDDGDDDAKDNEDNAAEGDEEKEEPQMDDKKNKKKNAVKNADAIAAAKKKKANFEKLNNAHNNPNAGNVREIRLGSDQVARGKELMGSGRY